MIRKVIETGNEADCDRLPVGADYPCGLCRLYVQWKVDVAACALDALCVLSSVTAEIPAHALPPTPPNR